jgi:hypothetical protein
LNNNLYFNIYFWNYLLTIKFQEQQK